MMLLVVSLGFISVCLILLYRNHAMDEVKAQTTEVLREVKALKLQNRTRIRQASTRTGAVTEEQQLRRLGRASAARRVVVGGDGDSDLNKALERQSLRGRNRKEKS